MSRYFEAIKRQAIAPAAAYKLPTLAAHGQRSGALPSLLSKRVLLYVHAALGAQSGHRRCARAAAARARTIGPAPPPPRRAPRRQGRHGPLALLAPVPCAATARARRRTGAWCLSATPMTAATWRRWCCGAWRPTPASCSAACWKRRTRAVVLLLRPLRAQRAGLSARAPLRGPTHPRSEHLGRCTQRAARSPSRSCVAATLSAAPVSTASLSALSGGAGCAQHFLRGIHPWLDIAAARVDRLGPLTVSLTGESAVTSPHVGVHR
jgi:hypothetical protein